MINVRVYFRTGRNTIKSRLYQDCNHVSWWHGNMEIGKHEKRAREVKGWFRKPHTIMDEFTDIRAVFASGEWMRYEFEREEK